MADFTATSPSAASATAPGPAAADSPATGQERKAGRFDRSRGSTGPRGPRSPRSKPGERPPQEVVKTWAFDSVGNRKYALQIRKASNGNPCLKIVEGVPQPDGTFRKFDLTVWSEDWPRLFETIDALRAFITEQNIKTPEGHKFDPNKKRHWSKKRD